MGDNHAHGTRGGSLKSGREPRELCAADRAMRPVQLEASPPRRLEARNGDAAHLDKRLGVRRNVALIEAVGRQQPTNDVDRWYIVVAGNSENRSGEEVKKRAGLAEFLGRAALGEITAGHHQIRRLTVDLRCETGGQ